MNQEEYDRAYARTLAGRQETLNAALRHLLDTILKALHLR